MPAAGDGDVAQAQVPDHRLVHRAQQRGVSRAAEEAEVELAAARAGRRHAERGSQSLREARGVYGAGRGVKVHRAGQPQLLEPRPGPDVEEDEAPGAERGGRPRRAREAMADELARQGEEAGLGLSRWQVKTAASEPAPGRPTGEANRPDPLGTDALGGSAEPLRLRRPTWRIRRPLTGRLHRPPKRLRRLP